MKYLFKFLFPNCETIGQQKIVIPPSDTSRNGTIRDGVVHCLAYGFHKSQEEPREGRQRTRAFDRNPVGHRMLVPKRLGLRARSRSDSPESERDHPSLAEDVMDPQLPRYDPDMDDVFEDPDTYVLKPDKLHLYFESHKPDLLLYKVSVNVPDQDFPDGMRDEVHVKIVFQISSHKDFSKASLYYHMQGNTKQCVQSCLSAFAFNQTVMYGIVVVVDGLKLVKVERQQNPNAAMEYNISETDLVTWDRTDAMHAVFEMIEGIL